MSEINFREYDFKAKRIEKGLSQIQAANKIGVSISGYINWERHVACPKEEFREKIIEVLGL